MRSIFSFTNLVLCSAAIGGLAGCATPATAPATAPAAPAEPVVAAPVFRPDVAPPVTGVPFMDLDFSGDQSALIALDEDIRAAGADPKKLAVIEARLVDVLRRPGGSVAARQAAAQRLGSVLALHSEPEGSTLAVLKGMLLDPRESDVARLALAPVRKAAVDALLIDALPAATGKVRLGILQTLSRHAPPAAVPALAGLVNDKDPATAAAAAVALGQIGTPEALAALRTAPATVGRAVEAQLAVARKLPASEAVAVFSEIRGRAELPAHQRAAALRGLLEADANGAVARMLEVLAGSSWDDKAVVLESIVDSPARDLVAALAAKVAAWDTATQVAVYTAFGRRGDGSAASALLAAARQKDAAIRASAVVALGRIPGNAEIVAVLAGIVASGSTDEAKSARSSLAQLKGPGVSAAILAGAEKGSGAARVAYLEQVALRNMEEGLGLLRAAKSDSDPAVRAAAIGAFGEIAPASELAFALNWAAGATDGAEQSRAIRAVLNIALRESDPAKRSQSQIFELLEKSEPAVAIRLLPLLGRLGGAESADCAARLALSSHAALAEAATAALARWPDRAGLAPLARVAAKASVPSVAASAGQAALRYFERAREVWTAEDTTIVGQLLGATKEIAARKRLATLLFRAGDQEALTLARKLAEEPELSTVAGDAIQCIEANLAGAPKAKVHPEGAARNLFDGKIGTLWRVPAVAGQWVQVDFGRSRPLHRLTLDQTGRNQDFPERYEVLVSDDPSQPGKRVAEGAGQRNRTVIELPAGTRGRYVTIRHTAERADGMWAICELFVD